MAASSLRGANGALASVRGRGAAAGGRVKGLSHPSVVGTRWFFLIAALMAFSWQSFVTQSHVHLDPIAQAEIASAQAVGSPQPAIGHRPSDPPSNCPICDEIAHACHYLLPAPIAFVAPAVLAAWRDVTLTIALRLRQPPRPWNSRAPPIALHA